jgi:hypothetical protein
MFPVGPPTEKISPKFKVEEIERIKSSRPLRVAKQGGRASLKEQCYFREDARPMWLRR